MAMIKFTGEVNHEGFEVYNYVVGQVFSRMKLNPDYLKNFDITPTQFRKAFTCKEKIKSSIIDGMKHSKVVELAKRSE